MIDADEIRKEIAVRHNIIVDKDDPLIVSAMLTDVLLEHCIKTLNAQNEAHQRAFSMALDQGVQESKKIASRIVTDGADYVSKVCRDEIVAALKEAKQEIRKDSLESKKAIEDAKRSGLLNGWLAASLTTLTLVVLLKMFV